MEGSKNSMNVRQTDETSVNNDKYPPLDEQQDNGKTCKHRVNMFSTFMVPNTYITSILGCNKFAAVAEDDSWPASAKGSASDRPRAAKQRVRGRHAQTKRSGIVAEYRASEVPDSKGSTHSIDDLVLFVNGGQTERHCSAVTISKSTNSSCKMRSDRRGPRARDSNGAVSMTTVTRVEPIRLAHLTLTPGDEVDAEDEGDDDDDSWSQVVTRRRRRKKDDATLPGTIVPEDARGLSLFIAGLWIDFQHAYRDYIGGDSNTRL